MAGLVRLILHTLSKTNWSPPAHTLTEQRRAWLWSPLPPLYDTPLIRLGPKTFCLAWLTSKGWCFTPIHTAFAHSVSISTTGKTGKKCKSCYSSARPLFRQMAAIMPLSSPSLHFWCSSKLKHVLPTSSHSVLRNQLLILLDQLLPVS